MPRYITGYIIAELTGAFLCRGVGKGGAGGAAAPPPLFEKGGYPPLFLPVMTTSCLQQCLCILMFTGQMGIVCPPTFLVLATPLLWYIIIYIYSTCIYIYIY